MRTSRTRQWGSRSLGALVGMVLITSLTVLAEPSFGLGEPQIAFLNPSSFALAGERGVVISDAVPDEGPDCCDALTPRYRFSAWTANAPLGARVFFSVVQRTVDIEIAGSSTSGAEGSWEADWSIPPEILDGPATVNAYMVVGDEAIAVAEQDVTIMRVQENLQLTYPESGGSFGTYSSLANALPEGAAATRRAPMGVVDAPYTATPDMNYVRTFYSTSEPGTKPVWNVCGTESLGTTNNTQAGNGVRCTLKDAAAQTAITAIAAVANDSPDEYEARFNQSGDAVAISTSYVQELTAFSLSTLGDQRVERETVSNQFFCSETETVVLTDQAERQIAGANVDVNATGPNDALKFDTFAILTKNQAPDRGQHVIEDGFDCTGQRTAAPTAPPENANPDLQGEHPRFGLPDRKHVESLAGGTSDIGAFSFRLHSNAEGVTDYTVWIDETDDGCAANDDAFTSGELSVTGVIGWGTQAVSEGAQPADLLVPCTPMSPDPAPSPTVTDPPAPDGSRTISLKLQGTAAIGKPALFTGRIEAVRAICEKTQRVVLKMRRPGERFWTKARGTTDSSGRFVLEARARVPRDYRAIAPASSECNRARSRVVRLRA